METAASSSRAFLARLAVPDPDAFSDPSTEEFDFSNFKEAYVSCWHDCLKEAFGKLPFSLTPKFKADLMASTKK